MAAHLRQDRKNSHETNRILYKHFAVTHVLTGERSKEDYKEQNSHALENSFTE